MLHAVKEVHAMLDLSVVNGLVVTPSGPEKLDVGVHDGRIVLLAAPGQGLPDAARVIDASDRIVVPGGIDPHVHTGWIIPTAAHLGVASFGPEAVSRAAAFGGTTTMIDFAFLAADSTLQQAFEDKEASYRPSCVDYAYRGTFRSGEIPPTLLDQVAEAIHAGHAGYKVWMTNTTPSRPRQKTDFGSLWSLLEVTAREGGMLSVHAEDDEIVMESYRRLEREGRWSFDNIHLAHSNLSEVVSFRRVIALAEYLRAPMYLMHVSAKEGVEEVRAARSRGLPIYAETLQHYASFTKDDYLRPNGAIYHTYPSLKEESDRRALWQGLIDRTLSCVSTDELCTDLQMKTRGATVDDVTGGHAGVEVRMGLIYTEAVARRGVGLNHFVDMTSANAARIFGMYPRKGAIAVGSDADMALLATFEPRPLQLTELHETDYSPFEGWEIQAWPTTTILRGQVVTRDGKLVASPGIGRFVPQRVSAEVLTGPRA